MNYSEIYDHEWFCLSKGLTGPRGVPGPVGPPGQKVSFHLIICFIYYSTFSHIFLKLKVLGLFCESLYYD